MQGNAVISALALILGKVRLGIKVSGSQSNCWKNKCTAAPRLANTLEMSKEGGREGGRGTCWKTPKVVGPTAAIAMH